MKPSTRPSPAVPLGLVCVFAKEPVPGRVKTRLARAIGPVRAARLASAFLQDAWTLVHRVLQADCVLVLDGDSSRLGLSPEGACWAQGPGDLGARLGRAFERGLCSYPWVLAVGTDSPGLPVGVFAQAQAQLQTKDAVLGPSEDGGYYLLGLRRWLPDLLVGLPWSTPEARSATLERFADRGLTCGLLRPWFDVDEPRDLERLMLKAKRGQLSAQETVRVLEAFAAQPPC